jgi:putative addiction module component (TIGR02574 family)
LFAYLELETADLEGLPLILWAVGCFKTGGKIKAMTQDVSELLKKALALPAEARAALAGSLLESLDDTVDASAEEEWSQEILRRIQELDSGKVRPVPWAEARRQVAVILNGR